MDVCVCTCVCERRTGGPGQPENGGGSVISHSVNSVEAAKSR